MSTSGFFALRTRNLFQTFRLAHSVHALKQTLIFNLHIRIQLSIYLGQSAQTQTCMLKCIFILKVQFVQPQNLWGERVLIILTVSAQLRYEQIFRNIINYCMCGLDWLDFLYITHCLLSLIAFQYTLYCIRYMLILKYNYKKYTHLAACYIYVGLPLHGYNQEHEVTYY